MLTVFYAFLRLGLTGFGGPVAHLGYFRDDFVIRRRWLDEDAFADIAPWLAVVLGALAAAVL